jgi:hypothetical protein
VTYPFRYTKRKPIILDRIRNIDGSFTGFATFFKKVIFFASLMSNCIASLFFLVLAADHQGGD